MIRAGKLDREVTIQRTVQTIDANGTVTDVWTAVATVRAELVENAIDERMSERGASTEAAITFRIRYLPGITVAHRVLYDGKPFNIVGLKEVGRRRALEVRVTATGD